MIDRKHWESFFEVTRASLSISNYSEFSTWLGTNFTKFLPHEMMIYYWGDFRRSVLARDVLLFKSNQEVATLGNSEVFNQTAKALHDRWVLNNSRWFMIGYTDPLFAQINFKDNPDFTCEQCRSVLVYGVRDMRGNGTCLYVFLGKEAAIKVDHYVIGMLMPYLDGAVKRIRGLSSEVSVEAYGSLTVRELEIMEWVNKGKTNQEIGLILSISHNTVKNHLKVVFKKLNVISRAQAVSKFSMHGHS